MEIFFSGFSHFLVHYVYEIIGIYNWIPELASGQVPEESATFYCLSTDYGRLVRKSPSLHGQKSNPNPKFLGTPEHILSAASAQIFIFL